MISFHEQGHTDITVAGVRVPVEQAFSFGILHTSLPAQFYRFQEMPARVTPMSADPARVYASMGNYLFRPSTLIELLEEGSRRGGTDFGRHIQPRLPRAWPANAYDFSSNTVPGIRPYEERGYWRDLGTLGAYEAAQQDLRGSCPRLDLAKTEWPIRPGKPWPVTRTSAWKIQAFDTTLPGYYGAGPAP